MFETNKRASRIAFGTALIVGALLLIGRSLLPCHVPAIAIMLGSWIAALVAGMVAKDSRAAGGPGLTTASIVVPSVGIALMLPLLIHLPFVGLLGAGAYESWVSLSILVVGPAHLVLAALVALRGSRLVRGQPGPSIVVIYALVVVASCFPFGGFVIPPILVALTGTPFIALLRYQAKLAAQEHETIEVIPRAFACA